MTGTEILNFIKPELLILIPVLIVLGLIIKGIKNIPDWVIPIVLGLIGILFAVLLLGFQEGFTGPIILTGIIQGILAAGMAVYVHQLKIQTTKKRIIDNEKVPGD